MEPYPCKQLGNVSVLGAPTQPHAHTQNVTGRRAVGGGGEPNTKQGCTPRVRKSGGMTLSVYCWSFQRALLLSQQTSRLRACCCVHGWW